MRLWALEIKMTDNLEQDTEKSKQAARPIFWIIGFVGIIIIGLMTYGMV